MEPKAGVDFSALAIKHNNHVTTFDDEFKKLYLEAGVEDPNVPTSNEDAFGDEEKCEQGGTTKYQYERCQNPTNTTVKATLPQKQGGKLKARDVSTRTQNLVKKHKALDPKINTRAEFAAV